MLYSARDSRAREALDGGLEVFLRGDDNGTDSNFLIFCFCLSWRDASLRKLVKPAQLDRTMDIPYMRDVQRIQSKESVKTHPQISLT